MKKSWFAYASCAVGVGLSMACLSLKFYLTAASIGTLGIILGFILMKAPELFESVVNYHEYDPFEEILIRICGGATSVLCGITTLIALVSFGATSIVKAIEPIL